LLNASVGVQRALGRLRRPPINGAASASNVQVRSRAAARRVQRDSLAFAGSLRPTAPLDGRLAAIAVAAAGRRSLFARLGPDRTVAVVVAGILLGASVISVSASGPAPSIGGPTGRGTDVRIAVGGGPLVDESLDSLTVGNDQVAGADPGTASIDQAVIDPGIGTHQVSGISSRAVGGPFLEDGTLLKPVAVSTTVADGRNLVRTYRVKAGDTLTGIASKFGISMMTIWWANQLQSKDALHIGQELSIPPVTGLVVTVVAPDTLDGLAQRYDVDPNDILVENKLSDANLVVGQVLVIPGAAGKAIPTPTPVAKPASGPSSGGGIISRGIANGPSTYTGGRFLWPVVGGGNYISQYFHYSHQAIDIAADYGSEVRAAASGTVVFAGWKNNDGGYQVWISHGSGLYTAYYHMSAISVGSGQSVSAGQQVGRIGQTGHATGPHLHFEVWRGPIDEGYRVNPLAYL
jgi:murein DD-endopeptidase MepM/ murein hydrolase activator NlpD